MILNISDIITAIKKSFLFFGFGSITSITASARAGLNELTPHNYSNTIWNIVLVNNIEQHFTIPATATVLCLGYNTLANGTGSNKVGGGNVYTKMGIAGITATIPTSNIIDGTGSEINPIAYLVSLPNTTISLIADSNTIVSLSFYSK